MKIFRFDDAPIWFVNGKRFSCMIAFYWTFPFIVVRRGNLVRPEGGAG